MSTTVGNFLGLSLILACSLGLSQAALSAEDIAKQLQKAEALMQTNKTQDAANLLREVIRTNPDNAQAHMQLGSALATLAENDDYETAILEEKQAIKLDPKLFPARIVLGHIYANTNKSADAIAIFKEAIEIRPNSSGAHKDLGIAYAASGNRELAKTELKKAIELRPEGSDAHVRLALVYSTEQNYKEALNEAMEGVKLSKKDTEAVDSQLALGNILVDSGNGADAVAPFKAVLAKAKDHPIALSGLGWAIAVKDDKVDEAIALERKSIKVYPKYMPAYDRLAKLLMKKNMPAEAEDQYKTALKISPDDVEVRTAYAKFLEMAGRKEDARAELKKALEKKPNYAPASDALAGLDKKAK